MNRFVLFTANYGETIFIPLNTIVVYAVDSLNISISDTVNGLDVIYTFASNADLTAAIAAMTPDLLAITDLNNTYYLNPDNIVQFSMDMSDDIYVSAINDFLEMRFSSSIDQLAAYNLFKNYKVRELQAAYNLSDLPSPSAAVSSLGLSATVTKAASALQSTSSLAWAKMTGTPTTLGGYGITDAATSSQGAKADTALQSQAQADWNSSSGASMILNKPTLGTAAATSSSAYATAAQGALAATALQTAPVTTVAGRTGTVTLSNTDISGLGTAATTASTAYATAAQGAKADTALQTAPVASVAGRTGAITLSNTDISGLGTAATTASSAYATAAQGSLAATAYQSSTAIPYSQLTGTPTIPAAQIQSDWNASSGLGVILNKPTIPGAVTINNAPTTPPIVTTNAAANGAVLSTTKDVEVFYSLDLSTTANISGNASVISLLQINPSSSTTTGWVTINKASNSQALTLAITLQSVQGTSGSLVGRIPAGYSHRILNTIVGTASATFAFGQTITQG